MEKIIEEIRAERRRQWAEEGWMLDDDDLQVDGQLAQAAACYALPSEIMRWMKGNDVKLWPWTPRWWNPKDRRRDLVRAAALIVAEIERLDRLKKGLS